MEEEEIVQPSNAENEDSFIRVKGADEEEESLGSNAFMRKSSRKRAISKFLSGVATKAIFYLPRSGKVMQKCRSKKKNKKKGLMDFETLKPLFLVLFGIILSTFEPV